MSLFSFMNSMSDNENNDIHLSSDLCTQSIAKLCDEIKSLPFDDPNQLCTKIKELQSICQTHKSPKQLHIVTLDVLVEEILKKIRQAHSDASTVARNSTTGCLNNGNQIFSNHVTIINTLLCEGRLMRFLKQKEDKTYKNLKTLLQDSSYLYLIDEIMNQVFQDTM